jgi:peptidoglycan hydrolase CwlO-like protein
MIRVDALVLLLLIESIALCAALVAILVCKNRKHKQLYRKVLGDLMSLKGSSATLLSGKHSVNADTSKQDGTAAVKTADAKIAQLQQEKDAFAAQVTELEKMLETDNKRFEDLQKKHATLEKEYSILYGKHFDSKEKGDPA